VVIQVRWDRGGTERTDCTCLYGHWNENRELSTGFIVNWGTISPANEVGFISDRMSYGTLKSHWSETVSLNFHASRRIKLMMKWMVSIRNQ
jgi:hypothetical protein